MPEQFAHPAVSALVVEDDDVTRVLICRMIARKFNNLVLYDAGSGTTGIAIFREHAPDIVITDVNMPGMDGIQMAQEMKALRGETQFIIVTAHTDRSHLGRFTEFGPHHYIPKPIEFRELFTAIDACIRSREHTSH